jgi:hypothetical protein
MLYLTTDSYKVQYNDTRQRFMPKRLHPLFTAIARKPLEEQPVLWGEAIDVQSDAGGDMLVLGCTGVENERRTASAIITPKTSLSPHWSQRVSQTAQNVRTYQKLCTLHWGFFVRFLLQPYAPSRRA